MQKSNVLSAPKADAKAQVTSWMSSKNQYLSAVLEQHVTNKQMLLIAHCFLAFFAVLFCLGSLPMAFASVLWFGASLLLAKKGGLR